MEEEQQIIEQIETKRRTSMRRSFIIGTNNKLSPITETQVTSDVSQKDRHLQQYLKCLEKERQDWVKEYQSRRNEMKQVETKSKLLLTKGQELDLTILSEEERAFLNDSINLERHAEINRKLKNTVKEFLAVTERANLLQKSSVELAKQSADFAIKYCNQRL